MDATVIQTIEGDPVEHTNNDMDVSENETPDDNKKQDEYDLRMFGIYQALPVEGEPDWESGEATTAEEYLRRVRYEAVRCPQVVRADIDTAKFDSQRTNYIPKAALHEAPACPDWSIPSPQWVKQFVLEFHQLRAALQHMEEEHAEYYATAAQGLPHTHDLHAWDNLCFGHRSATAAAAGDESEQLTSLSGHVLDTIMALEQVAVVTLLQHHIEALEQLSSISLARSRWLFALAARLETPIHADTGAAFRGMHRRCVTWRAAVSVPQDPLLPLLNVLIAVSGAYFKQDEVLAGLVQQVELDS